MVFWLIVALFLFVAAPTAFWFYLVIRDQWVLDRPLVAERFDQLETLRITAALLVSVAIPSGLLWAH